MGRLGSFWLDSDVSCNPVVPERKGDSDVRYPGKPAVFIEVQIRELAKYPEVLELVKRPAAGVDVVNESVSVYAPVSWELAVER